MHKTIWTKLGVVITGVAMMFGGAVSAASGAQASAYGCNFWNGGLSDYCVAVSGSGTYVSYVRGNFASSRSPICNFSITAEFFDSNSHWYRTFTGATHYGCWYINGDTVWPNFNAKSGFVCSSLRQNGAVVISRCAAIHP